MYRCAYSHYSQVLQDLTAGEHEVIVELPMRQIDGSIRFHVVRPE